MCTFILGWGRSTRDYLPELDLRCPDNVVNLTEVFISISKITSKCINGKILHIHRKIAWLFLTLKWQMICRKHTSKPSAKNNSEMLCSKKKIFTLLLSSDKSNIPTQGGGTGIRSPPSCVVSWQMICSFLTLQEHSQVMVLQHLVFCLFLSPCFPYSHCAVSHLPSPHCLLI